MGWSHGREVLSYGRALGQLLPGLRDPNLESFSQGAIVECEVCGARGLDPRYCLERRPAVSLQWLHRWVGFLLAGAKEIPHNREYKKKRVKNQSFRHLVYLKLIRLGYRG